MNPITVLLVDDHEIVREGFRKMLEVEKDLQIVGEASDGREAVALAKRTQPQIILMDLSMPRLNGLEATRQVLKALPETKVLMLSAHSDQPYMEEALNSGAAGFLLKQTSARAVCRAIREVSKGSILFNPLTQTSGGKGKAGAEKTASAIKLTSREKEVLQLIAEGKANKTTATELGISPKTVEKHRGRLMQKLKIHDTAGLTRYAMAMGIIEGGILLNPRKS